jgi:hypothetical protein
VGGQKFSLDQMARRFTRFSVKVRPKAWVTFGFSRKSPKRPKPCFSIAGLCKAALTDRCDTRAVEAWAVPMAQRLEQMFQVFKELAGMKPEVSIHEH